MLHICKILCEYSVHLLGRIFSLALPVSELSPRPTYIFLPSHFRDSWKDSVAQHLNTSPPTALMSQKSRTPLVHHFIPYFSTIPKPGATNPRPKHQALAPSVPMSLYSKLMFVRAWLTFNASARACGQQGWQTMWNLRTCKAICHNIAMSTTTHWSLDHEVKIKRLKNI